MKFDVNDMRQSTVWILYTMRKRIQLDPEYQRLGDIWTLDKRQFLIDTIINGFDIPKLYLHKFRDPLKKGTHEYDYAIIDGKQRLETMWNFIDGKISLADDFEYFKDTSVKANGMSYDELGKTHPELKGQFDGFPLSIVQIETKEIDVIEEMFSRLNEAAPLSAPEKRNAYGGPLPLAIRKLAAVTFFTDKLPFPNKRYKHLDLATKFLFATYKQKVSDTKKAYLDDFVDGFSNKSRNKMPAFLKIAEENVRRMAKVFMDKDKLLRQVGMVTLYYHLFRIAHEKNWLDVITRKKLLDFNKLRDQNQKLAEKDITRANYDLIEFDRYSQSPNDAAAIKFRLRVIFAQGFNKKISTDEL